MKLDARHQKLALLLDQGRFDELERRVGEVLRNRPHDGPLWYLLGIGRQQRGLFPDARSAFERAVELLPAYAPAHNNLGNAHYALGDYPAAIASFEKAMAADPALTPARRNLAVAFQAAHRNGEAIEVIRGAISVAPLEIENHKVLGSILLGTGRAADAASVFENALAIQPGHLELASFLVFTYQHLIDRTPHDIRAAASHYGALLATLRRPSFDFSLRRSTADRSKAPRVGLVSADFGAHPVGYFLNGVISAIDPDRAQLVAFSNRPATNHDLITAKLRANLPEWHEIYGLSDETAARLINSSGIDVLIDMNGHTDGERLGVFALRPAPVQATWLGWFSTTGVDAIDYIVADPIVLPPEDAAHFTERPWRLPDSYYCYTPDIDLDPGLPPVVTNGHITFGSFNRRIKLIPQVIDCWSRILLATPQSRLFLKSNELGDPAIRDELVAEFQQRGIGDDRLLIEGPSSREDYFAAFRQVDIALDSFCFTGGTTTIDGLWMGVPCLTLAGDRFIGHQGETILKSIGLADWIAADIDRYVAMAVAATGDIDRIVNLRVSLRDRLLASPICQPQRFARNLETAFQGMWSTWLSP